MTTYLKSLKRLFAVLIILPALYALAILLLGWIPVNRDWKPPEQGITIWLTTNGVHTGLILPRKAQGVDWSEWFAPSGALAPDRASEYDMMLFGWGDRNFYLNVPQWRDLTASIAFSALFGLDRSVLHVEYVSAPRAPSKDAYPITLSGPQYERLAARLLQSVALDARRQPALAPQAHYNNYDAFYEANGHYSLIDTCNSWTRDLLSSAGVRVPLWTPVDWPLFSQVKKAETTR